MEARSQEKLREILSIALQPISLELSVGENSETTLKDLIPGESDVATPDLEKSSLAWLMSHLGERERQILALRYGLDGSEARTFAELAEIFGISRESVRQQELKALKKLRELIARDHWN